MSTNVTLPTTSTYNSTSASTYDTTAPTSTYSTAPTAYGTTSTTSTGYDSTNLTPASYGTTTSSTTSTYGTTASPTYDNTTYSTTGVTPQYGTSVYDGSNTTGLNNTTMQPTYTVPTLPPRPVLASSSPDIVTSSPGPDIHSTTSFTTNMGVASQPIDYSNETLAKPSTGLMHKFKKMTLGGQTKDLEMDPMLMRADEALNANSNGVRNVHAEVMRYQQAQQALQNATVAVANAFHSVLADETNPYAGVSSALLQQSQMHSIVPVHAQQLTDLTQSALEDGESSYQGIQQSLSTRKTKASDVEYYRTKVAKLTAEYETQMQKGDVKPADKERLERNIGKMREIELEYNQENERVIADMNALWRRRIIRLGPAFSAFLLSQELVYREQLTMFEQLEAQLKLIQPEVAHNRYLTSSATMLVPLGSAHVDNRELINQAHITGVKGDVVSAQRQLASERQTRHQSVSQSGGSLETVAQETIVRSEEQMRITKERFVTERVRLRKVVVTEMVTITVPVRKERVEVERYPVDGPGVPVTASQSLEEEQRRAQRRQAKGNNANNANNANNNQNGVIEEEEDVFELILSEERPRVINDVVPIERVRMRKLRQVRPQQLEMDLLKEHIDYVAPRVVAGQPQTITMTGNLQTVTGQNVEGFTDSTNGQVQVVNRPGQTVATQQTFVKAEVDDVDAMKRIGFGDQAGAYGQVNTVGMAGGLAGEGVTPGMTTYDKNTVGTTGTNQTYYEGERQVEAPGTTNTFTSMTAQSDLMTDPAALASTGNRGPIV